MLIRIFAEKLQCFDFIYPIGPENCEGLGGIDIFGSLNGKAVSCPPAQQRESFIEYKIAGDAVFSARSQLLPDRYGAVMMLILTEIPRQECPGVDENHFSSPYRYRSWLDARSSGVMLSKTALSRKRGSSSASRLFSISSDFFSASLMYCPREILIFFAWLDALVFSSGGNMIVVRSIFFLHRCCTCIIVPP